MTKHLMCVLAFIVMLSGCAMKANDNGQFSTVPVTNHDMVIYTCTGVETQFVDYRPVVTSIAVMPRAVTVMDVGANWVATWEGGKLEAPQLYKDLLGKIDGNIDTVSGKRFYRTNGLLTGSPSFDYSTVNPLTGNGSGMTFFRCTVGPVDTPTVPVLITPSPSETTDKVDAK
ncbi:hypothetical protein ASESINO_174 [Erwinia phage vB_EamM_Asesino]|uniref:Lipoprotein n=1 Tax=Erwinia phage vB_EamM_Asesino TaxID=1883370 RepID=A0A1B2IA92_9CAUD|nr:hypothetical protein ASESINO_174 [Erwinia phage vB_EamM_Asesino]ANZ48187.1 hypothetical protein ASESINO_174 [Erwinia phage vB_EamM_Asesino]